MSLPWMCLPPSSFSFCRILDFLACPLGRLQLAIAKNWVNDGVVE
ncbi:hypothetical protein [Nostoc sp. KVJ3]|nr:hypothetical protein [Nostoc sp. KVJ3]